MKRKYNASAYNTCDKPSKLKLVEIIEKNTKYKLYSDLNVELYIKGDIEFIYNDKKIICENEVRDKFDLIVKKYNTIHIPIRKKHCNFDCYFVWRSDLSQFIFIDTKTINKFKNNTVNIECKHEMSEQTTYNEDFIDIPKKYTKWYIIDSNLKWIEQKY